MKNERKTRTDQGQFERELQSGFDYRAIRNRVAKIRREWTPEERQERAALGRTRRAELQRLLLEEQDWDLAFCRQSAEANLVG